MSNQLEKASQYDSSASKDEKVINMLDLMIALVRQKSLVIGMPILTGTMALAASVMMTPIFTSTAKVVPPQQQSSGATVLLGQIGLLAGAAGGIGLKSPSELHIGILESRTVADNLISRFKLKERYKTQSMDDARSALAGATQISSSKKNGMVSITVSDKDPRFAAELANGYVDELINVNQTMAISEAAQRRLFFERQLKETNDQLVNAEVALRAAQHKTGKPQPNGQVHRVISEIAQVKGSIAAKEMQISAMRGSSTSQNSNMLRAQEELRALQTQLAKLEKNQSMQDDKSMEIAGKTAAPGAEYVRSLRNVIYFETLFELLTKQFELAKIDEAKDASSIQLLDKAVPADRHSKPKRMLIVLGGVFGGVILGILFALLREAFRNSRQDPENTSRWQRLFQAWGRAGG